MNIIEKWYHEAVSNPDSKKITTSEGRHILYKGFKLCYISGKYYILDLRRHDFYSPVSSKDMEVFTTYGFIYGASLLMFIRDSRRVITYTKRIARLHEMKAGFERMLSLNPNDEFAKKRIRNCSENLEEIPKLLDYYTDRLNRTQRKYNFNKINV